MVRTVYACSMEIDTASCVYMQPRCRPVHVVNIAQVQIYCVSLLHIKYISDAIIMWTFALYLVLSVLLGGVLNCR